MSVSETLCKKKRVKNTIFYEKYEEGGVQIVFIRKNLRYTVYSDCSKSGRILTVWVRKNGTHFGNTLKRVTDINTDGKVDFAGAATKRGGRRLSKMVYSGPEFHKFFKIEGEKYFAYWQNFYLRAVSEIYTHLHAV